MSWSCPLERGSAASINASIDQGNQARDAALIDDRRSGCPPEGDPVSLYKLLAVLYLLSLGLANSKEARWERSLRSGRLSLTPD